MKMYLGGTPVKTMKVKHFEMDTNSADVQPSDMQAGITAFARGQKIVGTGKCFEFATYGELSSNTMLPLPDIINTIQISSIVYPIRQLLKLDEIRATDFSTSRIIAEVIVDDVVYPISMQIANNLFRLSCGSNIKIQIFYGKDNYI